MPHRNQETPVPTAAAKAPPPAAAPASNKAKKAPAKQQRDTSEDAIPFKLDVGFLFKAVAANRFLLLQAVSYIG